MAADPSTGRASGLVARSAGEADATRDLYERYSGQIFGYCVHQLGSREEAEDAVQSTFLNAFRGLKRGVVPEAEAAWLFKIAQNVCLSRRRSSWRRGRIEAPADFELVQEVTPAPTRRGDELMGLQDVLEQMPENQRRAILLREWQGLSYREIAEELELSQAAVETLIFRGRRALARGLEEPPEPKRSRLSGGAVLANLAAAAKALLLGGGAAVKVAATVAVVSGATLAASAPVEHLALVHHAPPASPVTRSAAIHLAVVAAPSVSVSVVTPVAHAPARHDKAVRAVPPRKPAAVRALAATPPAESAARAQDPPPAVPAQSPPERQVPSGRSRGAARAGHPAHPARPVHAVHPGRPQSRSWKKEGLQQTPSASASPASSRKGGGGGAHAGRGTGHAKGQGQGRAHGAAVPPVDSSLPVEPALPDGAARSGGVSAPAVIPAAGA